MLAQPGRSVGSINSDAHNPANAILVTAFTDVKGLVWAKFFILLVYFEFS